MQCKAFTRNFSDPPFRSVATFVFTRRHHLLKRSARRNAKSSSLSPSSSSTEGSFNLSISLTLHESRRQKAKCQFGFDTALFSEHTRPTWCFSSFCGMIDVRNSRKTQASNVLRVVFGSVLLCEDTTSSKTTDSKARERERPRPAVQEN